MAEPLTIDVYYSFRSPFCYLATPRLSSWAEKYNLQVRLRPILPLVIRKPEFFQKANPMMVDYHNADAHRVAEYLGLPFPGRWADPDPVVVELVDGVQTMGEHQPFIYRLTYLGVLAEGRGRGVQFAKEVSSLIWVTRNWHEGEHLAEAVKRAGLDITEMDDAIAHDQTRLREIVDANQESLKEAGHWGVPTVVFNGEPFFGQDRLDLVLWRLKQHGLKERHEGRSNLQ